MMRPIGYEELKFDEKGEPYFERTISEDGTTKKVTMEENGFVKQLEVSIIVRREGYSPSMEKRIWFGLQKLKFQVPLDDSRYHDNYLYFNKHMGFPCVRHINLKQDFTEGLDMSSEFIQKTEKAQRITALKARELLQNHEVLGIFNDFENQLAERV
jgi:hypothetical protein